MLRNATSKFRKQLRIEARKGLHEVGVVGTPKAGYCVVISKPNSAFQVSKSLPKQKDALALAYWKTGRKAKKLVASKFALAS